MRKIGSLVAISVLAVSLVACGGGGTDAKKGSTDGNDGQKAPSASSAVKRPCDLMSKEEVGRIIGQRIVVADDLDDGTPEPTTCYYYTNLDKMDDILIHWMALKDALWDEQIRDLDQTVGGVVTVHVPGAELGGEDAFKDTHPPALPGDPPFYEYFVKKNGDVIEIGNLANLPDGTFRAVVRAFMAKL